MPDNEYADAPTTTGQHEHDFILQSTSFDNGFMWVLLFRCECEATRERTIDTLWGPGVPTLAYGPYRMADLERWLTPEDPT